jgi:glycosyltransferase involved in cell wall biosynthesis
MIVALDARMKEGVGTVVRNLALRLSPRLEKLILLGDPNDIAGWGALGANVEVVPFLAPIYGWREQATFPAARLRDCSLLHVPHFNIPVRSVPCPLICSIHDVAHLSGMLPVGIAYRMAARTYYRHAARRSRHVITGSQFSRDEIVRRVGVNPEKITVIPDGVDADLFSPRPESEIKPVLMSLGIRKPYVLMLGSVRPHKNVGRVLKAFEELKRENALPHQLVVVGRREGFRINQELPVLAGDVWRDVVFTGFRGEKETVALYSGADLFVFASLYEGFGLPPLEAMACGAPVAVSRAASLPEVVGEGGAYFDPYSVDDIGRTLLRLLTEPRERDALARKGRERALRMTWERTVEGHLEVYRKYGR